jgi:hypothetical protein
MMTVRFASSRSALAGLIVAVSLTQLGCAAPLRLTTASHVAAPSQLELTGAQTDSVIVQVRYFSFSPTVSVVAWTRGSGYGLRGWIRGDGSLVMDHRVYVSTYYHPTVRSFPWASIPSRPLFMTGISRDDYACYFGKSCSPFETFGAFIPDKVLRPSRNSIPVTFYAYDGREIVVTVHHQLIDAYLATVDSVSAELSRRNGAIPQGM